MLIKKSALQPSLPPGVRKPLLEIYIFHPKCIPFFHSSVAHSSEAGTGQEDRTQAPLSASSPNALRQPLGQGTKTPAWGRQGGYVDPGRRLLPSERSRHQWPQRVETGIRGESLDQLEGNSVLKHRVFPTPCGIPQQPREMTQSGETAKPSVR